jgi:GT2 family glycosyltransferase
VSVCAVVVTYNRAELLLELVRSLVAQTSGPSEIVVLDNASTDGTERALRDSGLGDDVSLRYLRLRENEGPAGGFYAVISAAMTLEWDWLWVFDDDASAEANALAELLSSELAADPGTAALCPATIGRDGRPELNHRGTWNGTQLPLRPSDFDDGPRAIDYASYLGILVRRAAIEATGLPKREFFVWSSDVEWTLRLSDYGQLWLLPTVRIRHYADPSAGSYRSGALGKLAMARKPIDNRDLWKYVYGFRNAVWLRKQRGERLPGFALYLCLQLTRIVVFNPDKAKRLRLFYRAGIAGRRGRFRSVRPADFLEVIEQPDALRELGARSFKAPTGMPEVAIPMTRL